MTVNTTPITDAADDLASSLTEGAQAVDALGMAIVNALVELDRRLEAVEEGGETTPPINPEPPEGETGTIPMSFNDPIFTGMTEKTSTISLSNGQNLSKTSIKEQSGNPTVTSLGNNKITTCRVQSRECVRITNHEITVENCYLESKGQGDDHADTIQAYAPGARGKFVLKNTHVRAFNQAATAGIFIADNWTGTIEFTDVIIQGGPYGSRIYADQGGDNIIRFRNVFYVGPFYWSAYDFGNFGGHRNIFEVWENVCHATIENGQLVPGAAIPKPGSAAVQAESMTKERAIKEMKDKPPKEARE